MYRVTGKLETVFGVEDVFQEDYPSVAAAQSKLVALSGDVLRKGTGKLTLTVEQV